MRIAVVAAVACSVIGLSFAQESQAIARRHTDIPAQGLGPALQFLAKDRNFQVVYVSEEVNGVQTAGAVGEMTPDEALTQLLSGTGLTFRYLDEKTVTVVGRATADNTSLTDIPEATPAAHAIAVRLEQIARADENDQSAQEPGSSTNQATPNQQSFPEKPQKDSKDTEFEEIVVTGTHIRGVGGAAGTDVLVVTGEEIDRAGHTSLQGVMETLPQNFGGGATEETLGGTAVFSNFTNAAGVNLRGLGHSSTLLLVNGRRLPTAGLQADFYDLSSIPILAVSRIEVLPDGASALYGADAVAGVVNVILRDDYEGAETRLRFGTVTEGDLDDVHLGQIAGGRWSGGNVIASFEYSRRDRLRRSARRYLADSDLQSLGGDNFSTISANPGNILDPSTGQPAYAIPAGQDGTSLEPSDLLPGAVNYHNTGETTDILQRQERYAAVATVKQDLSDRIEIFGEGRFNRRNFNTNGDGASRTLFVTPDNPFFVDPFGAGFVLVEYNFIDDLGPTVSDGHVESLSGVFGARISLGQYWQLQVHSPWARDKSNSTTRNLVDDAALNAALANQDPAAAFNPFGDGSHSSPAVVESVRMRTAADVSSEVWSLSAIADGPVVRLPGGDIKLVAGVDFRKEQLHSLFTDQGSVTDTANEARLERRVSSWFGEIFIPLFGEGNRIAGFERLTLSAAIRTDDYRHDDRVVSGQSFTRDLGRTTNPKIGLLWSPLTGLNLRGTYGTSFRAPSLPTLGARSFAFVTQLPDPQSPTGISNVIGRSGTNPLLENETAKTWTAGIDYKPPALPDLRAGLTYFNVSFEDRITAPANPRSILVDEARFASIVNRNPSAAEIAEICNGPEFILPPFICQVLPIAAIVDARFANTARTKVDGLDFNLAYGRKPGDIGRLDGALNVSYLLHSKEAFGNIAPFTELLDTVNNPADLRARGSLTWSSGTGLSVTGFVNYTDSYADNLSSPGRKVDAWTTVDLAVSFDTDSRFRSSGLDNTRFSFNVTNVFDADPPFVNNPQGIGYDPTNADPLGRFISFSIAKTW